MKLRNLTCNLIIIFISLSSISYGQENQKNQKNQEIQEKLTLSLGVSSLSVAFSHPEIQTIDLNISAGYKFVPRLDTYLFDTYSYMLNGDSATYSIMNLFILGVGYEIIKTQESGFLKDANLEIHLRAGNGTPINTSTGKWEDSLYFSYEVAVRTVFLKIPYVEIGYRHNKTPIYSSLQRIYFGIGVSF